MSMTYVLLLPWLLTGIGTSPGPVLRPHMQSAKIAHGWLFPSDRSRVVRFVSETKVVNNPTVFVPFQTSGFILLFKDSFSISLATPTDVLLFKYKDGALSSSGSDLSASRHSKRMQFSQALSEVLDEVACEGVGGFCNALMSRKSDRLSSNEKSGSLPRGKWFEAEVGDDACDLRKFTVTYPNIRDGVQKTICTFTQVLP